MCLPGRPIQSCLLGQEPPCNVNMFYVYAISGRLIEQLNEGLFVTVQHSSHLLAHTELRIQMPPPGGIPGHVRIAKNPDWYWTLMDWTGHFTSCTRGRCLFHQSLRTPPIQAKLAYRTPSSSSLLWCFSSYKSHTESRSITRVGAAGFVPSLSLVCP